MQGGHEVLALDTGLLLSTPKITKLPLTDVVVKTVENMASSQSFKSLKFQNRRGEPIYDVSLIAGVDYEANLDANLDPPNAPDEVAKDQDADKEDQDDDSNDSESDDNTGVENWDKDDEDLEIESNPKIHQENAKYGDGEEVRDLEILHSDEEKSVDS